MADTEPLVRFLTSDNQFSRELAKPSGFMPGPRDGNTSVFRQAGEPLAALWETADRVIAPERRVKAAALLMAIDVRQAMLEVIASEPPLRHADITGWPQVANDPDSTRAKHKELALLLARASTLVRR